ncbi:hypothetical protein P8452_44759 [Trifolium repens]|nr:hypothetical protein P8452_44759 [Trifolium repens]
MGCLPSSKKISKQGRKEIGFSASFKQSTSFYIIIIIIINTWLDRFHTISAEVSFCNLQSSSLMLANLLLIMHRAETPRGFMVHNSLQNHFY